MLNLNRHPNFVYERRYLPNRGCSHMKDLDPVLVYKYCANTLKTRCVLCIEKIQILCISEYCLKLAQGMPFCLNDSHWFAHAASEQHPCFIFVGKNRLACVDCNVTTPLNEWLRDVSINPPIQRNIFQNVQPPLETTLIVANSQMGMGSNPFHVMSNLWKKLNKEHSSIKGSEHFLQTALGFFEKSVISQMIDGITGKDDDLKAFQKLCPGSSTKELRLAFEGNVLSPSYCEKCGCDSLTNHGLLDVCLALNDPKVKKAHTDNTGMEKQSLFDCVKNTLLNMGFSGNVCNHQKELNTATEVVKLNGNDETWKLIVKQRPYTEQGSIKKRKVGNTFQETRKNPLLVAGKVNELVAFIHFDHSSKKKRKFRAFYREQNDTWHELGSNDTKETDLSKLAMERSCALFYAPKQGEVDLNLWREAFLYVNYKNTCYLTNKWCQVLMDARDSNSSLFSENAWLHSMKGGQENEIMKLFQLQILMDRFGDKNIKTHLGSCWECAQFWKKVNLSLPSKGTLQGHIMKLKEQELEDSLYLMSEQLSENLSSLTFEDINNETEDEVNVILNVLLKPLTDLQRFRKNELLNPKRGGGEHSILKTVYHCHKIFNATHQHLVNLMQPRSNMKNYENQPVTDEERNYAQHFVHAEIIKIESSVRERVRKYFEDNLMLYDEDFLEKKVSDALSTDLPVGLPPLIEEQ